jgi:hypothetical protein
MKLPELTNRSLRLLESILDQAHERLPSKLDFTSCPEFIYLHAENICELGKDALALEKQNRSRASRILVRPMFESLFALVAAARNSGFPARKLNAEWKDEIKRIKKWIDKEHLDEFQAALEEAERKIRAVEQKYSNREEKEWNAYQTAEEAALTWHYRRHYFVFQRERSFDDQRPPSASKPSGDRSPLRNADSVHDYRPLCFRPEIRAVPSPN